MPLAINLFNSFTLTTIAVSGILIYLFWQRRKVIGFSLSLLMICVTIWLRFDLISALSTSMPEKIFWYNMSYFAIVFIPVVWFDFSMRYTNHKKYLTRKNRILISLVPLLTLLSIWTNGFHHLYAKEMSTANTGDLVMVVPTFGAWYWIFVAYSYVLIIAAIVLLIAKLIRQPRIGRRQTIILLAAAFTPFICNFLFTFYLLPSSAVDPTPFSFILSGVICFWGMFRYNLFDLVPIAREAVIENMEDLIIVLDTKNKIIDINSTAQKMIGRNAIDLLGQPIEVLLNDGSAPFMKYIDMIETHDKIVIEDGENKIFYDFRMLPLYDSRGVIKGRFVIMRDISALEEAMESLKESIKAAEDANKAKSQFLATMSHEIRTPLYGIIGMGELLNSAVLTQDERVYLETMQDSADSLLEVINDILDFSKIEAGKMELSNTDFDLKNLIATVISLFRYKISLKNIPLMSDIDPSIPQTLAGDPIRLRQVLVNLIGNAVKFTEAGHIEIKVEIVKSEAEHILLQFSVIDTGIGIPAAEIDNLFESFRQVDNSTSRKFGGTGLGLAIVKNIISIMGGHIEVESKLGEGSRFTFTLPFRISESKPAENPSMIQDTDFSNNNINILLAEDMKANQIIIVKILEKKNLKVDVAENGIKVLEKMKHTSYDLILMDIQMPEMDGYETTLAIRAQEADTGKHVPIIALTANATSEDITKCIQLGMDDYLSKPVKSERLFACIKKYVS